MAGDYAKSIEQGKQALSTAKKTGNKEWEAKAYVDLARSYYKVGDYEKSIEQGKQALSAAKETGNKEREAAAYVVLACSYNMAGDYEKSIEQGKQALSAAKETGNKEREAKAYDVLACSYVNAGDYEKSIEQGKQALSAAKETGNKEREAKAYDVLAWSYYNAGDYEKSIEQGKQALSAVKETGNKEWEVKAYTVLARSYYKAGDYEKSTEKGKQALNAAKETGNKEREAAAYVVLAWSYYKTGDYEKSIEQGKQALRAAKETRNKEWEAKAYDVLAWSYYKVGDYRKSIEQGKQALKKIRATKETGNKEWEAKAYDVLAWSYYKVGDHKKSIKQGKQTLSAAKETGNKEREAEAYDVLAWSYYFTGDYEKSIEQGKQALSAAKERGNKEREAEAYEVLAMSYHGLGDHVQARFHERSLEERSGSGDFQETKEEEYPAHAGLPSSSSARFHERSLEERSGSGDFQETKEEEYPAHAGLPSSSSAKQLLHDDGDDNDDSDGDDDNNDTESDSDNDDDDGNDGFLSSLFCVGGGDDGNDGNMGDAVNDEVSEEQDLIQQFHELQLIGQEGDPVEQDPDKTKIYEGTVASEGTHWDLKQGAVQLAFSPGAVSEPISIMVLKWKCSACSPQLQEHEAIVSNVIEISTKNGQPLKFNAQVMLMLYHSAPDLQGYELVIKMQIDKEISEWVDVDGTEDLRRLPGIDTYASSQDKQDLNCFIARASITKCSTYTVVFRLKSSPPYTITSNGGSFGHPYYPGVTVYIPEEAVAPNTTFPLVLEAQEIPIEEYEEQDVFVGPFLRIICSRGVEFLKPVTIHLPVHVRGGPKGIPDLLSYHVRVLFLRSDGEYEEWIDITSDLEHPPSFDGTFVKFQVKHFCRFTCICGRDEESVSHPGFFRRLQSLFWNPPRVAQFFAFFRSLENSCYHGILCLICCTAHFRNEVLQELKSEGITPSEDHSVIPMIPGHDKAYVFVSGGISALNIAHMEDYHIRFESISPFRKQLGVRLSSDQDPIQVEFYSTPSKEKLLSRLLLAPPSVHYTTSEGPTPYQQPAVRPGHHPGTDNVYNMTAHTRGITLIINNNLFEHNIQSTRDGSEEDVREIAALFHALGFNVDTKQNLTRPQLLKELKSVAHQDHSGYDCFVLWLMSHGKSGKVVCSDGKMLSIQSARNILSKCTTLSGKPKLFFIQACRGDKKDEGFADMTDVLSPLEDPPGHVDPPSDADNPSASRIIPKHADFLYAYATVDGYVSYRRPQLGSHFVRALVDVFRERANRDHLVDMLTVVNEKVSKLEMRMSAPGRESGFKKFKEMPEVQHTLRKKLWF